MTQKSDWPVFFKEIKYCLEKYYHDASGEKEMDDKEERISHNWIIFYC